MVVVPRWDGGAIGAARRVLATAPAVLISALTPPESQRRKCQQQDRSTRLGLRQTIGSVRLVEWVCVRHTPRLVPRHARPAPIGDHIDTGQQQQSHTHEQRADRQATRRESAAISKSGLPTKRTRDVGSTQQRDTINRSQVHQWIGKTYVYSVRPSQSVSNRTTPAAII